MDDCIKLLKKKGRTFIVAEVGQNHNGDIKQAFQLIVAAQESGADAVKFTKMSLVDSYTKEALSRSYMSRNSFGKTYGEHRKVLEFTIAQMRALKHVADAFGMPIFWSVCDVKSLRQIEKLGNPIIKIPSREITNLTLLEEISKKKKVVFLSTGLGTKKIIKKAVDILTQNNKIELYILYCVSQYPTECKNVKIDTIEELREFLGDSIVDIGYSSHTASPLDCFDAASLKAKIIERHITLDCSAKGSDHVCSSEPEEFEIVVDGIRSIEEIGGSGMWDIKLPNYVKREMRKRLQRDGSYKIE